MTRRLIEAQEKERAPIGRELHGDINQRLAMLAAKLQSLQSASQVQETVQELHQELAKISDDVQALSHELHASKTILAWLAAQRAGARNSQSGTKLRLILEASHLVYRPKKWDSRCFESYTPCVEHRCV
jgi:signal transduction histidine kinase